MSDVPSPCNRICILDPATQVCIGCFRTLDEIARWSGMDEDEKARVVADLPARRERLSRP